MTSALSAVPVSTLTADDLPACLELAAERGWAPEAGKWRLLLDLGDGFAIKDPTSGRLAAAVIVTTYQQRLAVIGMLLVSPAHAHQGLASRLTRHALHQAAPATVFLYATEQGEPLYRRLGFQTIDTVVKHRGRYQPPVGLSHDRVRPVQPADLPAIIDLDEAVFGSRREHVISRLLTSAEHSCLAGGNRGIHGYAAAWRNLEDLVIGPVIARDDRTATRLIRTLAQQTTSPITLDLPSRATTVSRWLNERGLHRQPPAPLMTIDGQALPGIRRQLYSPIMQALG